MRRFYVALAETRREWLEAAVDTIAGWRERLAGRVTVGVLVRYTRWRSKPCLPCLLARDRGLPVFVDNGAFTFLTRSDLEGQPRLDVLARWRYDYAVWLRRNLGLYDHAALPDIPVHGRRFLGAEARRERVRMSAGNQSLFLKLIPGGVRERMVPVLQGYTVEEYMLSYRLLEEYGVLEDTAYSMPTGYLGVLAVGSVCVRKPSSAGKTGVLAGGRASGTLHDFLREFLDECCPSVQGFHLFGLHSEATRRYARHPRFHAADTGAHGLNYRLKWRTFLGCRKPDAGCYAKAVDHQLRGTLEPLLKPTLEEAAGGA